MLSPVQRGRIHDPYLAWAHVERVEWGARLGVTHVMASDGGKVKIAAEETADGREQVVFTSAVVANDGSMIGGVLMEEEENSYVAELMAMIAALQAAPAGARVMLVFDATSPLLAWWRWSRAPARVRQKFYCAELLNTLDSAIQRLQAVVLLWQTSHVGEPWNEWVDEATRKAVEAGGLRVEAAHAAPCGVAVLHG